MISRIEYTSKAAGIDAVVTEAATFNVLIILAFALMWYFNLLSGTSPCLALAGTVAIINALLLVSALRRRRSFDTLRFSVPLPAGSVEERERLQAVLSGSEQYLVANRVSHTAVNADGPRLGRPWAPERSFRLEGMGLRLDIFWNARGGSGLTEAEIFLGPVTDGNDPVARRLLDGLRQELLRLEEGGRPETTA